MTIERARYSTDLMDDQWFIISPLFQEMRNRLWPKRELVNAILYKIDNGCKWRNLPHYFPPWQTVYSFFRRAKQTGLWDEILQLLVDITRQIDDRLSSPTYAIIDSQSMKTVGANEERGIDGGKKIKGRKRHIMGNLLAVVVHAANILDTKAGIWPAEAVFLTYPTIRGFCGDAGYKGTFEEKIWEKLRLGVDISERISTGKWEVLPKRWIVERTFSWFNNYRGLSKDYKITRNSAETMIKIAHIHTLLKRL